MNSGPCKKGQYFSITETKETLKLDQRELLFRTLLPPPTMTRNPEQS